MTIKSAASDLEENNGEYFTHIQHKNLASIKNLAPTNMAEKILEDQSLAIVTFKLVCILLECFSKTLYLPFSINTSKSKLAL